MKLLRFFLFFISILFFQDQLIAQVSDSDLIALNNSDSLEIPVGVIYVRKPHIDPFIKVDYKLYLSKVTMVNVEVPVGEGIMPEIDQVPVYDSLYYRKAFYVKNFDRNYPVKTKSELLSRKFAENLKYQYSSADTPRVDTLIVGMEILIDGTVKYITPYTDDAVNMPQSMIDQLVQISNTITTWGTGGGYQTKKKKFLKPIQKIPENYYCELYIIVSSYPLTQEQKNAGTSYSPFDYPLNSPTMDDEQKASLEKNRKPSR